MAKIVVIDDETLIRRVIARVLTGAGHAVFEAKDGHEGIALFNQWAPDLVITDIIMPDKEGIETILELRKRAPELPILVISGSGEPKTQKWNLGAAQKLGANAMLGKPFRAEELLEKVGGLLNPSSSAGTRTN